MADAVAQYNSSGDIAEVPLSQVEHNTRLAWYEAYRDEKSSEIWRAKRDSRYCDGDQWDADEVAIHAKRGQPDVVYNRIQPKIQSILGYEVKTRVDPEAYPRTPEHEDSRGAITDALRYIEDEVKFDATRSALTEDIFKPGCGAVVLGIDKDTGKVFTKRIRWRNICYDPASLEPDFSDAKWVGSAIWWDKDDAIAEYGATEELVRLISDAASRSDYGNQEHPRDKADLWTDPGRKRLLIVEMYWREGKQWWTATTCYAGDLTGPEPVPYVDENGESWCPWMGTSCYVVQEDDVSGANILRQGERYGIVRNFVSPQDTINQTHSRAMHDLNMYGAIGEKNAVKNVREFLRKLAQPGEYAEVQDNALKEGRVQIREPGQIAQGALLLMQEAKLEIDAVGPSLPVTAGDDSALSGRAILARQSVGAMELAKPFDNIRQLQHRIYSGWWWLIRDPQHGWKEETWLRVRDSKMKEGYRFVAVNRRMTRAQRVQDLLQKDVPFESAMRSVGLMAGEGEMVMAEASQAAQQKIEMAMAMQAQQTGQPPQVAQEQVQQLVAEQAKALALQHPIMQQEFIEHDVARLCMDILIAEAPDTTIAAHEETMELLEFGRNAPAIQSDPQLMRAFLKALIQNSNLRSKQELLESLEQKPDPAAQQMQQAQMQQMQLAMQQMQAQIANLQANAQLTAAKVQTEQAKAQIQIPAEAQRDQADALSKAASAGEKSALQPPMMGGV